MEHEYSNEIDLMSLVKILFHNWYIVAITTALLFGLAFVYAYMMLDNQYTANTSMIILVSNESQTNEQNFNFSQKLSKTYTELAKSDQVIFKVIDNLNLSHTPRQIRDMVTITGVSDTIIIKLSVETDDQMLARDIANEMVLVMQEVSMSFEGFDNIEILDTAQLPQQPSGPNRVLYVVIGVLLGGILGVGIIFIMEMVDKTVKSPQDIEQKLGLRLLAAIPDYEMPEEIEQ